MKQEIERKFLVTGDGWRANAGSGVLCRQGYITDGSSNVTVRVRLLDGRGFLTIKGPAQGLSCSEMEYEIPSADAEYMLNHLCIGGTVSKVRYTLNYKGLHWEIDEFFCANDGLVLAEIELESEKQPFDKPEWLEKEVSFDSRYRNAELARNPFKNWKN
ncbi:MAG: CYTH domain-containing protein [Kiritimatiellales bacterium]